MASTTTMMSDGDRMRTTVRSYSGLFLAQGILLTLLGIVAIVWQGNATSRCCSRSTAPT